jgi:hypothetical protein
LLLRNGEIARVFVADGKILKVEVSSSNGAPRQRLMSLLDWRDGQFEFSPCAIGGKDELQTTVTQILLEHARVQDERSASPRAAADDKTTRLKRPDG